MQNEQNLEFRVHAERTPNPNSIKWVLGKELDSAGIVAHFEEEVDSSVSPLASSLFQIQGVTGVSLVSNTVTMTKTENFEWTDLAEAIVAVLRDFAIAERNVFGPGFKPPEQEAAEDSVTARIIEVIETEIRPAVAGDGGDVLFAGFENGVVHVHLQGACVGCPSSTDTLRFGIEGRLKEVVPQVREVVAI